MSRYSVEDCSFPYLTEYYDNGLVSMPCAITYSAFIQPEYHILRGIFIPIAAILTITTSIYFVRALSNTSQPWLYSRLLALSLLLVLRFVDPLGYADAWDYSIVLLLRDAVALITSSIISSLVFMWTRRVTMLSQSIALGDVYIDDILLKKLLRRVEDNRVFLQVLILSTFMIPSILYAAGAITDYGLYQFMLYLLYLLFSIAMLADLLNFGKLASRLEIRMKNMFRDQSHALLLSVRNLQSIMLKATILNALLLVYLAFACSMTARGLIGFDKSLAESDVANYLFQYVIIDIAAIIVTVTSIFQFKPLESISIA